MTIRVAALICLGIVLIAGMAHAGVNRWAKVAVHVLPHESRSCAKNFPAIVWCDEIVYQTHDRDVDAFPVFFDLVEYQGFEYGITFPGPYSCAFTSCSDLAVGTITWPGDGISQAWYTCQAGPSAITGWGWIYGTGIVQVIAHPAAGGPIVGDCAMECDEVIDNYYAGVGSASGYNPCGWPAFCDVEPTVLNFGSVAIDSSADLTFSIACSCCAPLIGYVSEECDHYSIISGGGPYTLGSEQSLTVTVRFEPTAEDTHTCEIFTGTACDPVMCTGIGGDQNAIKPTTWGEIKSEF
jgi:hypothetical protein